MNCWGGIIDMGLREDIKGKLPFGNDLSLTEWDDYMEGLKKNGINYKRSLKSLKDIDKEELRKIVKSVDKRLLMPKHPSEEYQKEPLPPLLPEKYKLKKHKK